MGFRKRVYTGLDKWKIAVAFACIFAILASPYLQNCLNYVFSSVFNFTKDGVLTPLGLIFLFIVCVIVVRVIIN